jgi:hypothetical protein
MIYEKSYFEKGVKNIDNQRSDNKEQTKKLF